MKRWIIRGIVVIVALLSLALVIVWLILKNLGGSHPLSGSFSVAGISTPVRIVRDNHYIPHVIAENNLDLFFGAGYVVAQDRFFQLDTMRRAAQGRLSELTGNRPAYFGLSSLMMDKILRTFRFGDRARRAIERMDPETLSLLQAFSAGINAGLKDLGGKYSFEYILGEPEPWKPTDSLAVAQLFGLTMTSLSIYHEYIYSKLSREKGPEAARLFFPRYGETDPTVTGHLDHHSARNDKAVLALARTLQSLRSLIPQGSNNWVVSGSRTRSGSPILCNDPHVPMNITPTYWYHIHLQGGDFNLQGIMFPGFPAFGAASNQRIAWGLTNVMADYFDLFRERVNPRNPNQYLYQGQWVDFDTVEEIIRVRGSNPIPYRFRVSGHGPVVEPELFGEDLAVEAGGADEVLSFQLVEPELSKFTQGYLALARARDWESFVDACALIAQGPVGWNQVYADRDGNIGYWATMHLPRRPDNQGALIRRGWTGKEDWQGYVPFRELPHAFNPEEGFIVTANNRIAPLDYPYYISDCFVSPWRAARIRELLQAEKKLGPEEMKALQSDVVVIPARTNVPLMIEALREGGLDPVWTERIIQALTEWEKQGYRASLDSVGCSIYHLVWIYFLRDTFQDELGEELTEWVLNYTELEAQAIRRIIDDKLNSWFDNRKTPAVEDRSQLLRQSIEEALRWLREHQGDDPEEWKWGNVHTLSLNHPLGEVPVLARYINIGTFPYPGSDSTINAAYYEFGEEGFRVFAGPTSRLIIDLSDLSRVWFSSSTGPSGDPHAPHYRNLTDDWLQHRYRRLSLNEEEYLTGSPGELKLLPAED
jgi:penicillin amidase